MNLRYLSLFYTAIVGISFAGLTLLFFDVFDPVKSVALGIALSLPIYYYFFQEDEGDIIDEVSKKSPKTWMWVLFVVLLGFVFRYPPHVYIEGGFDSSNYLNMGAWLSENSSLTHVDPALNSKMNTDEIVEFVKDTGVYIRKNDDFKDHYEGAMAPGIYLEDLETGTLVFQFYHLLPVWLAIAAKFLGVKHAVFANVFFGVLIIWTMALLVWELTKSHSKTMVVGLIFALHPLFIYFSKYTVSETIALFFSASSFLYLVKFIKSDSSRRSWGFVTLSVGFYACFCFTRISGFMYLPFILASYMIAVTTISNKAKLLQIHVLLLSSIVVLALSIAYGYLKSFPYSHDQFNKIFVPLFGAEWHPSVCFILASTLIGVFIYTLCIAKFPVLREGMQKWISYVDVALILLIFLFVITHFIKVYYLATTDCYANDEMTGTRFHLYNLGWKSVASSSLYVTALYLCPLGIILFFANLFSRRNKSYLKTGLLLFLIGFIAYISLLQWVMPYQFYWGRYLMSEVIPYSFLFIVLLLPSKNLNKFYKFFLGLIVAYQLYFSIHQFNYGSFNSYYDDIETMTEGISDKDLILFDNHRNHSFRYRLPFVYTFDRNFVPYNSEAHLEALLTRRLALEANDIYIMSDQSPTNKHFLSDTKIRSLHHSDLKNRLFPPIDLIHRNDLFYISKLNLNMALDYLVFPNKTVLYKGLHSDNVWTKGDFSAAFQLHTGNVYEDLFIATKKWRWKSELDDEASRQFSIMLNDVELDYEVSEGVFIVKGIKKLLREGLNILEIKTPTFVPSEQRGKKSNDTRALGLDITRIYLN